MIVFDSDDFGASHVISDQCQSHDCRDMLDKFHYANNNFKVTLFAIPSEMTAELGEWCKANSGWVELAVHGFFHRDNWECEKMTYDEMEQKVKFFQPMLDEYFVKGFKAPGWQISQEVMEWLHDRNWWIADQGYNDARRPEKLPAYVNYDGKFAAKTFGQNDAAGYEIPHYQEVNGIHTHTWNCVGNGVYELEDQLIEQMKDETEFRFVSEVLA